MTQPEALATLTVDVAAVAANWSFLKQKVGAGVEVAGVVKANCYGLGVAQIAPVLARSGCRTYFVATLQEGIDLRQLVGGRIFVLSGPTANDAGLFTAHDLTPVINSPLQAQIMRQAGGAKVALHLDTGMTRLGLSVADIAQGLNFNGLDVQLIMSHMACADELGHAKNPDQLTRFQQMADALAIKAPLSLGASSTIFLGSDYHFDLVRPGAALYGLNPMNVGENPMRQVVGLRAKILQIRDIDTPCTVGYGATFQLQKGRTAIAGIGYADGLFRSLSNRGFGYVNGVRVPIIGRISMDLTTFDITALGDQLQVGMEVELIGPNQSVDDLADQAGTIGYEVLTNLGHRYLRCYSGG